MAASDYNLESILSSYFTSPELDEYKKNSSLKDFKKSIKSGKDYRIIIDTLITFAQTKLPALKLTEFYLHLGEYSTSIGELNTAELIYEKVLSISEENSDLEYFTAQSYLAIGDIASRKAEWSRSTEYVKLAASLFEKQKDYKGSARCENILGTIYGDRGELQQAIEHFEKGISYLEGFADDALMGMVELNLGVINSMQGNYDTAFSFYQRARLRFEQRNDHKRIAELRNNIGLIFINKGNYTSALTEFDASINLSSNINYLFGLVISYLNKAYIYTQLNDLQLAAAFSDKAMEGSQKLSDWISIADIYKIKGIIERKKKNYKAAEQLFLTSLRINGELENRLNEAETMSELSELYVDTNRKDEAVKYLKAALNNYNRMKADVISEKIKQKLAAIDIDQQ